MGARIKLQLPKIGSVWTDDFDISKIFIKDIFNNKWIWTTPSTRSVGVTESATKFYTYITNNHSDYRYNFIPQK